MEVSMKWVRVILLGSSLLLSIVSMAQDLKTRNIIIITLDGYRWKELYQGADPRILDNDKYVTHKEVRQQFNGASEQERRERLMPFFWNVIAKQGQLYGNRAFNNKVNCSNIHLISYPGYSEMLVGFADPKVSSNRLEENPNATVLEFINTQESFKNEVAAFGTWNAFPYILRKHKAKFHINAAMDQAEGSISEKEKWMNENPDSIKNSHGYRKDEYTFQYAFEFLKREKPRVMFIGFDETDTNAHGGRYDEYLQSANETDKRIGELWQWIQSQPDYKDQTTLLITTDHGRGNGKRGWKNHRLLLPGSGQIWFAVIGPDTPAFGEMKFSAKYYQKQVAKTVAAFLGLQYKRDEPVGEVVQTMLAVPVLMPENTSAENTVEGQRMDNK
jgi:hypothetical protein